MGCFQKQSETSQLDELRAEIYQFVVFHKSSSRNKRILISRSTASDFKRLRT